MTAVMQGVRILEVAEHTFVPAASALLADWGAEVIKIEHAERGDAMRGLASSGTVSLGGGVHVLLEHSNRGKQSLGLDLASEEGLDILYRLAASCDVFLTNKMPSVRTKLKIDVEDIRSHNPSIIYVRGTGQGERGPDADRGSYDSLAYWNRAGIALGCMQPDDEFVPPPPAPAFGDSIGAMTIAGGIMGALFHRERTGEATTVDVSLLGTGIWSMGAAMALSLQHGVPWRPPPRGANGGMGNPLVANYRTKDDRFVALCCLQAAKYWPEACEVIGRPELAHDERFADAAAISTNAAVGKELVAESFAERTLDEWRDRLSDFSGQWTVVQDTLEAAADPQAVANGYVLDCATSDGTAFKLATAPVQFDEEPAEPKRAPEMNEHGDAILSDLGIDWDTIVDLKVRGIVA
ncbi:MAG TPA: CoA transferase [Acidimicrobiales bacterium]|jgi:crotonobetainyl-CoA:carnitine CoA-transferase CaiB-like acyl-CoA transferase|nr:CoA transferase [Acidimicrobiales bacterium]